MEGVLAIILIFGGGTTILLSFSPVGRALAARIRGEVPAAHPDPELRAELEQLRHDVADLQERLDFTERVLSQRPDPARLPSE
jgi:hypothetical protein